MSRILSKAMLFADCGDRWLKPVNWTLSRSVTGVLKDDRNQIRK